MGMDIQIKSALIGAIIPTVGAFAIFFLGDFSTQSKLERDTVKVLSEKFDSVEKDMSYEDALQAVFKESEVLKNQLSLAKDDLSSAQSELSKTQNILSSTEDEFQSKLSEMPKVEYSDFDININGEVTENLKKSFLSIDGRDFVSFDTLNKITNEEVNYSDNVLYIGHDTGTKVDLMDVCPPYDVSSNNYYSEDSFEMTGKTYDGFSMVSYGTQYVLVNIEGKYSNLIFDFGHIDGEDKCDCTLNIYLDDKLEKTIEQRADANVSHINIPLNYSNHLKFEFYSDYLTRYGLGNIKLKY